MKAAFKVFFAGFLCVFSYTSGAELERSYSSYRSSPGLLRFSTSSLEEKTDQEQPSCIHKSHSWAGDLSKRQSCDERHKPHSAPVSFQKELNETAKEQGENFLDTAVKSEKRLPLNRDNSIEKEPVSFIIEGEILEKFESPASCLTLKSVFIDGQQFMPKWLWQKIKNIQEKQKEKDWRGVCDLLDSIYDCSAEEEKTFPAEFAGTLSSLYIGACLRLFEESTHGDLGEPAKYNLCYAFCTEDASKIADALEFRLENQIVPLDGLSLSTTGVYLFTLGRFWESPKDFSKRDFGPVYSKAANVLNTEGAPSGHFISWALKQACFDQETKAVVEREKPEPFLF